MVVTPSFTHLSITFSNPRFSNCSLNVEVGFVKLTSDSFCGNKVFKMTIQFRCPVTCAAVILWFLETVLLNVRRTPVSVDFRPLFLFADVCADITTEIVALDTPNNVAVFVTDASTKRASTSPIPILSHGLSLDTIANSLTRALQSIKKLKRNNQCCQLKLFQCSQHKFYSSVS
jgi:hypothetical protein